MGGHRYRIMIENSGIVADRVDEFYVPVIVKALMSEYFADPSLKIVVERIAEDGDEES